MYITLFIGKTVYTYLLNDSGVLSKSKMGEMFEADGMNFLQPET